MAEFLNSILWIVGFIAVAYIAAAMLDNSKNKEETKSNLNRIKGENEINKQLLIRIREEKDAVSIISQELKRKETFINCATAEFNSSFAEGRKWLSSMFADLTEYVEDAEARLLAKKKNPALKAAEQVKEANKAKREAVVKLKFLEYQLLSYKEKFPFLEEYEEELLNEEISTLKDVENIEKQVETDPSRKYLSNTEYQKLSESERNQLALNRYLSGQLSRSAIGRLYERYLGYRYEQQGFRVEYHGIVKGFEDFGRDLICARGNQIHIVQAKCWAAHKVIHENHICQLFGTVTHFRNQNPNLQVKGILITSAKLSYIAKEMAEVLGISYKEDFSLDKNYPMIKCNISKKTGEKIYHLPFDQQYDRVKIEEAQGELYVATIFEAEFNGFRRAFKHFSYNYN